MDAVRIAASQECLMSGTAKVWVISRYGWEYDDSRYYRPESDGGIS